MSKEPPEDSPGPKPVADAPKELDPSDLDFAVGAGFGSSFLSRRLWGGTSEKDADWELDENELDELNDLSDI